MDMDEEQIEEAQYEELSSFLRRAVNEALKLEDGEAFQAWMREEAPRWLPDLFSRLPDATKARIDLAPSYSELKSTPDVSLAPTYGSVKLKAGFNTTAEETFAALYEDPVRLRRFTQFMDSYSILQGEEIARRLDFTPYRCLMDVAGGPGGLSIAIGRHYPHLRGVIMDLPPVCTIAAERIAAA